MPNRNNVKVVGCAEQLLWTITKITIERKWIHFTAHRKEYSRLFTETLTQSENFFFSSSSNELFNVLASHHIKQANKSLYFYKQMSNQRTWYPPLNVAAENENRASSLAHSNFESFQINHNIRNFFVFVRFVWITIFRPLDFIEKIVIYVMIYGSVQSYTIFIFLFLILNLSNGELA